ncbi:MAG: alpha/beta hydrolase [Candidatus Lloydbacteria bacterium]|nr:alpha/beta hydrolase [Candidatus Lloydbacteria bacterium]
MKESFFDDKKIYYRVNTHAPQKPNVIFIHGLSGSSSAWIEYEKKFAEKWNLISLDLRGHGKSFRPHEYEEYAIRAFANDVYELLTHLNIKNPILISHSFGTMVALDFLARYPTYAGASLFLSPSFKTEKRLAARLVHAVFKLLARSPFLPLRTDAGTHIDYAHYKNTGDWNIRRMFADIKNTGLRPFIYATEQSFRFDRSVSLSNINIPVLIMHGKKDSISPVANAITMTEKIKNARLILLENADHILVLNNFKEVCGALHAFIHENQKE